VRWQLIRELKCQEVPRPIDKHCSLCRFAHLNTAAPKKTKLGDTSFGDTRRTARHLFTYSRRLAPFLACATSSLGPSTLKHPCSTRKAPDPYLARETPVGPPLLALLTPLSLANANLRWAGRRQAAQALPTGRGDSGQKAALSTKEIQRSKRFPAQGTLKARAL